MLWSLILKQGSFSVLFFKLEKSEEVYLENFHSVHINEPNRQTLKYTSLLFNFFLKNSSSMRLSRSIQKGRLPSFRLFQWPIWFIFSPSLWELGWLLINKRWISILYGFRRGWKTKWRATSFRVEFLIVLPWRKRFFPRLWLKKDIF